MTSHHINKTTDLNLSSSKTRWSSSKQMVRVRNFWIWDSGSKSSTCTCTVCIYTCTQQNNNDKSYIHTCTCNYYKHLHDGSSRASCTNLSQVLVSYCTCVQMYNVHTISWILKVGNGIANGVSLSSLVGHFRNEAKIGKKQSEVGNTGQYVHVCVIT